MLSTTLSSLPDMMAHASSAGAPFDSEVSTADLDSEAFATTPSATSHTATSPSSSTQTLSTDMQLDMLTQLLDSASSTASTSTMNCAANTSALHADPSVIAISPLVLKLESPLLSSLPEPSFQDPANCEGRTKAASSPAATSSRKGSSVDPSDKEAKVRERVLRNRAAAQESRDKKRKYVSDIETSNEHLQQENTQLLKRLKTVESDNQALSQRLEALTVQFEQMQQLLSQSIKHNQPGAGFCQSAVLAKKDKKSHQTHNLSNSRQQKLAPPMETFYTTTSKEQTLNNHRQVYSMTMKTMISKRGLNREARSSDQSATQNRKETSCRSFCNNSRKKTLTLSSSIAASFPAARPPTRQLTTAVLMMAFLTSILPQLMLNFSTLFLISTGMRSSNPQELQLQQTMLSFIRQLSSSRPSNLKHVFFRSRTIKGNITSLNPSVIEDIVTEFRRGRKDVARGLLVKALLFSRLTLDNDNIKGSFTLRKK